MDLYQKIESYMQRYVNFETEVILRADSNQTPFIDQWNITTQSKPDQIVLDAIVTPFVDPVQTKITNDVAILTNQFNTFSLGVQAAFAPAKNAVLGYMATNNYTSALEVVTTYPLIDSMEQYRQVFEVTLKGMMADV